MKPDRRGLPTLGENKIQHVITGEVTTATKAVGKQKQTGTLEHI